jgi:hypothetical protein
MILLRLYMTFQPWGRSKPCHAAVFFHDDSY